MLKYLSRGTVFYYKITCVPIEDSDRDSDQPVHSQSTLWVYSCLLRTAFRLLAQADLSSLDARTIL